MGNDVSSPQHEQNEQLRRDVLEQVKVLKPNERAFIYACRKGDIKQMKSLIESNVNPTLDGLTYCTPLHFVVCSPTNTNQADVVKLLLQHSVSPLLQAKNGASSVHMIVASQCNDDIALELLDSLIYDPLSSRQLVMPDNFGNTPLHLAAQLDRVCMVLALLRKAEKYDGLECIFFKNYKSETALHLTQSPTVARILLTYEPKCVNEQDSIGRTALHYAVAKKNLPLTMALLDKGASPEIQDKSRYSPLSLARQISVPNETDYLLMNNLELYLSRMPRDNNISSFRTYIPDNACTEQDKMKELQQKVESIEKVYQKHFRLLRLEYDAKINALQQQVEKLKSYHDSIDNEETKSLPF